MKLPPLRAVQYFEVVARLLSFSRAAVELNVSQSAVSHQIRLLEDFLGERLLLRQGRLLSLTAQGEVYFEGISAGLGQIAQSSEQLRGGGEKLSGGGRSSGLMSFLKIGDRAAGAIKSGGTTRRAAKMVELGADLDEVMNECELPKAEAELLISLRKGRS